VFFIIIGHDRPDSSSTRAATKLRHMKHLDAGGPGVRVLQSGPLLSLDSVEHGSLIVVEAADKPSVEEFLKRDPYMEAELFSTYEIHQWLWRRGNPHIDSAKSREKA
jgi:uncharacterized protein